MKTNNLFSLFFVALFLGFSATTAVSQDLTINARVYLQGALMNSTAIGETHGRPLMRDDLRRNPFNNARVIPNQDIYQVAHNVNQYVSVDVTDKFTHVACGTYAQYINIPSPSTVFNVTGENAIVDWVFVELRDKNDYTSTLATRSGLLQRDGDIVDLDGTSPLEFINVPSDAYFIVVRHRNHLGVMTKYPIAAENISNLIDFTDLTTATFDFGNTNNMFNYTGLAQKEMSIYGTDYHALWGGDFDADGSVVYNAGKSDLNVLQHEVAGFDMAINPEYKVSFDGSVGYLQGDFDMNGKSKFNAPYDDKNLILVQVATYQQNTEVRTNFVHLREQIPN